MGDRVAHLIAKARPETVVPPHATLFIAAIVNQVDRFAASI